MTHRIQPQQDEATPSPEPLRNEEARERLKRTGKNMDGKTSLIAENLLSLLQTYNALHDTLNEWLATSGLSLAKYNLLILLKYAPECHLRMAEIGERMSVTCANITKLVDGLEREGLVRRGNLPGDRRVVLAELTPKGDALMEQVMPYHHQRLREIWSELSEDDILQMIHLLMKLNRSMRASSVHSGCMEKE